MSPVSRVHHRADLPALARSWALLAVLLTLAACAQAQAPVPAGPRFRASTDIEAAHACLDHDFRYFVRTSPGEVYCLYFNPDDEPEAIDAAAV